MVYSISNIWFMSQPAVRICAVFVAFSRVCSSTVVVGALGPSSSSGIPYQCMRCSFIVPVLCLLFYTVALLSLQIAVLDLSLEQGTYSWIAGWVGQSGVLAPWGVTVVAAPGPLGHPASICDVGVNLILSYLFIWNIYTGRLSSASKSRFTLPL